MIGIASEEDIADVNAKLEAVCKHLKIKLLQDEGEYRLIGYHVVTHWPFEGGFPREPLDNPPEGGKKI